MLALLELLKSLSNPEGSGIEGLEIETPQSEIGKILRFEASPKYNGHTQTGSIQGIAL
jgi:hypothetical protein